MKAIVYSQYGHADVLHLDEIERPEPGDDEILISVRAAEATKGDCEMRSFRFAVKWFWLPLRLALGVFRPRRRVLGGYFSGKVERVGENVTKFRAGDEVFGATSMRFGAYAEYVCLPASYTIARKPVNLSHDKAAAVPLGGLNAIHFMRKAGIRRGEKLLVNGAGGSIGTFAVQIARLMGAEVTVVDGAHKEQMLRSIGADHFIDYEKHDFTSSGETYDVIFDMVAGSSYSACVNALNDNGRYLLGNPRLSAMLRSVVTSRLTSKTVLFAFARETQEELEALKSMIEAGQIRPVVDKVYPMEQAAQAHRRVETEKRQGIVVIRISQP